MELLGHLILIQTFIKFTPYLIYLFEFVSVANFNFFPPLPQPFDKLWKERPNFHRVLHPIEGDIMEEKLGLKDKDSKLLSEEVEIVFHSAATIRFDEHIR